jgi:hypothetical protein
MSKHIGLRPRSISKFQCLVYLGMLFSLAIASVATVHEIHAGIGLPLWRPEGSSIGSSDLSASMVWLFVANITSFGAVSLLWRGLRAADTATRNLRFILDLSAAKNFGISVDSVSSRYGGNPVAWALRPLEFIYLISLIVLVLLVVVGGAILLLGPNVSNFAFFVLVLWTGLIYVLLMTICDLCARHSFKRFSCLQLTHDTGVALDLKARAERTVQELREALGDFDRMIWYVDIPFLIGVAIILLHKLYALGVGEGYYYGFLAGAVAMHTILANLVSLGIALSDGDMSASKV